MTDTQPSVVGAAITQNPGRTPTTAKSIDLAQFSFQGKSSSEGRPPYHPKDLLKLYVYGYLNSIRSSRALERECKRNIEVMWLIHQLVPDHNTISNFRRDNEKAIRKVFRHTVSIARQFDLIGGRLIAGDSTKLRAQNSKKNNFNESIITSRSFDRAVTECSFNATRPAPVFFHGFKFLVKKQM